MKIFLYFQNVIKNSEYLRSTFFANLIILFTMIPQFLLVPLILRYWGEIEYSNYVGFLAAINIFTQIYGAVQNGYIITLSKIIKF